MIYDGWLIQKTFKSKFKALKYIFLKIKLDIIEKMIYDGWLIQKKTFKSRFKRLLKIKLDIIKKMIYDS